MRDMWIVFTQNHKLDKVMFRSFTGWTEHLSQARKFHTYKKAQMALTATIGESRGWDRGVDLHPRCRYAD